jgi:uncharacterized membrane protein required for colicin V production
MSWIDILFLAIIIVFVVLAYRRGLMRTVLEVVAFVAAVVVALYIASPVANMFYNSFVRSSIEKKVENQIQEINFEGNVTMEQASEALADSIPDYILNVAEANGISRESIINRAKSNNFDKISAINMVMTKVVEPIAVPAIKAMSFIMLSGVLLFLFRLFAKLLSSASDQDGFSINKLLGGLVGMAKGVVVVYVVCAALQLIYLSSEEPSAGFGKLLADSRVFNFMIDNNPIIEGLKNMF